MSRAVLPLVLAGLLLGGCAALQPEPEPKAPAGDPPPMPPAVVRKAAGGGVYRADSPWSLTSDSRAFRPGDVVTVVLQETTQASKKADTKYAKQNSVSFEPALLAGKVYGKTEVGIGAGRDFNGTSTSTQQNTLQGAITVVVQEVMPNGLLRVGGEKSLTLNHGEEFVRLQGYLRAEDVTADNRVSSQRVANARIAYSGRGALADANEPGWFARFFNSPFMPF